MKRLRKMTTATLVALSLIVGATTAGASFESGVRGSSGQLLSEVITLSGSGAFKNDNGALLTSSYRTPQGLLALSDGTVLIADTKNHLIRRIKDGQVTTFAGISLLTDEAGLPIGALVDGPANAASFNNPQDLTMDREGNIYVADTGNHAIRKISPDGKVSTVAGNGVLGSDDGKGNEAGFYSPQDMAVSADGTIYVADTLNHVIRKIDKSGNVTTLNAPSTRVVEIIPGLAEAAGDFADGLLSEAKFNEPTGLAIDSKGNLYVADAGNHRIRYVDLGAGTVSTVAGADLPYGENDLYAEGGFADGSSLEARFNFPKGLALTQEGGLLIADSINHSIRYLHKGSVETLAGTPEQYGFDDSIDRFSYFHMPLDVAVEANGDVIIADAYNNKIRRIELYRYPDSMPQDPDRISINVLYGKNLIEFDQKPEIKNDRTMLPVRAVSEKLNYKVEYTQNGSERNVLLVEDAVTVVMTIGKKEIRIIRNVEGEVSERIKEIDVEPYIEGDRTYIPLRFFSEELGLDVQWDKNRRAVILRDK
jgi:sugar lactone lactonase YvrE